MKTFTFYILRNKILNNKKKGWKLPQMPHELSWQRANSLEPGCPRDAHSFTNEEAGT